MAKANFFNKGLLKGEVVKSEIVEYDKKGTKVKGHFLSMEIDTGNSNKVKANVFPTKSNDKKDKDINKNFPVGSMVQVSGNVQEREYEKNGGGTATDRSVQAFSVKGLDSDQTPNATFIIQGIVEKIREVRDEEMEVTVRYEETYENKDGEKETKEAKFTLGGNIEELLDDNDVEVGCNAKFKGYILNQLEFDEFGDVIGNTQMFQVARIESVIDADDLNEEEEEVTFL